MNPFTELRRDIYHSFNDAVSRDLALAEELLDPKLYRSQDISELLMARRLSYEPEIGNISVLLPRCTQNIYIRRYIADGLRRLDSPFQAAGILQAAQCPVGTVLDIAGDAGIPVFDTIKIRTMLESPNKSQNLISVLGYLASNPDEVFIPYLESMIPDSEDEKVVQAAWDALAAADPESAGDMAREAKGRFGPFSKARIRNPLVLQTVFYGDPGRPGKGGSGGIGTLVMRLGNALATEGAVTCTPGAVPDILALPVQEEPEEGHTLYRFPVSLPESLPETFLRNRPAIGRAFKRTLDLTGIRPEVVHVRFLDDASLAVVRESRRRNIPCAVTLTPDPHRSLLTPAGTIRRISNIQDFLILHRIWTGDELARESRGWMAIGRDTMMGVVHRYFPQTELVKDHSMASVDEGVPGIATNIEINIPLLLKGDGTLKGLSEKRLNAPIILSVGRLAPVKNMPALAQAWADGLWKSHNLAVIGGDWENPTTEEKRELEGIRRALASAPEEAEGRSVFLSARSGRTIAELEAWLGGRHTTPSPDIYVASSLKEEFGLAILEAMSAGMVSCAPINGGAGSYIRSGVNGFLINTADAGSLKQELDTIISDLARAPQRVTSIREAARETVQKHYSIEAMAREYAAFYRRTIDVR